MANVYCKGTARIRHNITGTVFDIQGDELHWDVVSVDQRQMGPEVCFEAEVEHSRLGSLSWSLWEYPRGVENARESKVGHHEIIEDFDYGFEHAKGARVTLRLRFPEGFFTIASQHILRISELLFQGGTTDSSRPSRSLPEYVTMVAEVLT
jgi:hypothetical protein